MWACKIYLGAGKFAKSLHKHQKRKKKRKEEKKEFKMNVCVVIILVQFGWRRILIAGTVPSSSKSVKFTK